MFLWLYNYFDYFTDGAYEGQSIDTMIEEMDGGGLYNIVGEQEDDFRDEERTRDDDYMGKKGYGLVGQLLYGTPMA